MTDTKQAQQMINSALALYDAKVKAGQANPLNEIQPVRLNLSVGRTKENALKLSFPFKSMRVASATDLNTFVTLVPENNDLGRSGTRLGLLDSFETEFGFSSCYVYWPPQAGKEMVLEFYTTSKVNNGRLVLETGSLEPDNFSIGPITTQNDGNTFIALADPMFGMSSIDNGQLMNTGPDNYPFYRPHGNLSNAFGIVNGILVPAGFIAELISWRAYALNVTNTADLSVYPKDFAVVSGPNGLADNKVEAYITLPLEFNRNNKLFEGGPFYRTSTRTCIIDENRVFALKNISAAFAQRYIFEIMYRIKPKVV